MGPSNWVERASRLVVLDESDDDGIFPVDMTIILRDLYRWVVAEFSKSALSRHFGQARDSLTPFFETFSQYRLYHGGIDMRPMHTEQQWLSWPYLEIFYYMNSPVSFLKAMGLAKVLGSR